MPFKDTSDGQTHSYNDGCGEPAHNEPIDMNKCPLCQFEEGHSQECPRYKPVSFDEFESKTIKTQEQELRDDKEEAEIAIFWSEIERYLPKSIEMYALGQYKVFTAFKIAYPKIKSAILSKIKERDLRIEGEIESEDKSGMLDPNETYDSGYMAGLAESRKILRKHGLGEELPIKQNKDRI